MIMMMIRIVTIIIMVMALVNGGLKKFINITSGKSKRSLHPLAIIHMWRMTEYCQSSNTLVIVPHVHRLDTALLDVKQDAQRFYIINL